LFISIAISVTYAVQRSKLAFIPLLAILLSFNNVLSTVQFSFHNRLDEDKKCIKIMSYNVRGFNKFTWIDRVDVDLAILSLIKAEDPDIVCFQEYCNIKNKKWQYRMKSWFRPKKFYKAFYRYSERTDDDYGIAVFSKYPIIKSSQVELKSSSNTSMYVDIKIKKDTIRLFNNHLQSIQFVKENYDFIDSLGIEKDDHNEIEKISVKLREAFKKRAIQVNKLSDLFKKSPYPIFVCGDFNDTPVSYTYKKMSNGLKDSFKEAGSGLGCTFDGIFHIFRIDYLLHSPEYKCVNYKSIEVDYSDHFPIICKLVKSK
jgi:endonuclease/exonuclease/phosphatase family metal-dependent hydrolase